MNSKGQMIPKAEDRRNVRERGEAIDGKTKTNSYQKRKKKRGSRGGGVPERDFHGYNGL